MGACFHCMSSGNKFGLASEIHLDIKYHMTTNLLVTIHITGLIMPDLLWCMTLMNLPSNLDFDISLLIAHCQKSVQVSSSIFSASSMECGKWIPTLFNQGVCTFGSCLIGHRYDTSELTLHINICTGVTVN